MNARLADSARLGLMAMCYAAIAMLDLVQVALAHWHVR